MNTKKLAQRKLVDNYVKQIREHLIVVEMSEALEARGGVNGLIDLKAALERVLEGGSDGTVDEITHRRATAICGAVQQLAVACAIWGSP